MKRKQNFVEIGDVNTSAIPKPLATIVGEVNMVRRGCSQGIEGLKHDYYSDQPSYEHYRHQATVK